MSWESERAALEGMMHTAWLSGPYHRVTVIYENTNIKQPSDLVVYHRITASEGRQQEVAGDGPALHRYLGAVQIDIAAQAASGTATARAIADYVATLHRRKQITDTAGGRITFRTPSIRSHGLLNERYRITVICPFVKDIIQ